MAERLFSLDYYLAQFTLAHAPTGNAFEHYLRVGAWRGFDPHPLFDSEYYLDRYPDVAAAGINPLVHYVSVGQRETRDPHPLFDSTYYLGQCEDPVAPRANLLDHYLTVGAAAGLEPHPLFDSAFLRAQGVTSSRAPLEQYLRQVPGANVEPNRWFDTAFYLARYPDAAASGLAPLAHYVVVGAPRVYDPHPLFDAEFYRGQHPGIPPAELLAHHLAVGARTGEPTNPFQAASDDTLSSGDPALPRYVHPYRIRRQDEPSPRLTLLLPNLTLQTLTGGPNTALRLASLVAAQGVDLRLVSTDYPIVDDAASLVAHCVALSGAGRLDNVEVVDGHDRAIPLDVRSGDCFLATSWWTAHIANAATRETDNARFLYLVQDFEPCFYAASTEYALALETYAFPHVPIVNSELLLDYLGALEVGQYADRRFVRDAMVFEPVPDPVAFHPAPRPAGRPRRALFYARPSVSRNLYELGMAALRRAARLGAFDDGPWEFGSIGDPVPRAAIDATRVIEPFGWPPLDEWARLLRESDFLLSLILSPHPSYPPIEMAACGGLVVTNTFGPKDEARLARYGSTIHAAAPTVDALAASIVETVASVADVDGDRAERATGPSERSSAAATAALEGPTRQIVQLVRSSGSL